VVVKTATPQGLIPLALTAPARPGHPRLLAQAAGPSATAHGHLGTLGFGPLPSGKFAKRILGPRPARRRRADRGLQLKPLGLEDVQASPVMLSILAGEPIQGTTQGGDDLCQPCKRSSPGRGQGACG